MTGSLPAARLTARGDAQRRRLIWLVFLLYGLLILEGAIRKWVFPDLWEVLFFIRVPFTLLLYFLAFYYRRWPRITAPLFCVYLIAIMAILLIPIQLFLGGYTLRHFTLAAYGWIMYFFYIPMAFLIGEQFRREDMNRLMRYTLLLAVAAAPLVLLQFFSPLDSLINRSGGIEEEIQFRNLSAALGYVRPTGFFTSPLGQSLFVTSAATFIIVLLTQPQRMRAVSPRLLWVSIAAVMTMISVGGSRSMFAAVAVVLLTTIVAGVIARSQRNVIRAGVWPLLIVVVGTILWPVLFPKGFEVFMARWALAWESETQIFEYGFFGRVFWGFYAFLHHLEDTPVPGYLLGIGGNAAKQLEWIQMPPAAYAWEGYAQWVEDSWSGHIVDLGLILGLIIILSRIALTVWLGLRTARVTRRTGDIFPFVLFGFLFLPLLYGQIQGQGTLNGYIWMFFGFCIATARNASRTARKLPAVESFRSV